MPEVKNQETNELTGDFWIRDCRLSFPNIVKPKAFKPGDTPKFSASFILTSDNPDWKLFMAMVNRLAAAKWAENAVNIMAMIKGDKRQRCYGVGTDKLDKKGGIYAGYDAPNTVYVGASDETQPQMYGADGTPMDPMSANTKFVGGNYVSGIVRPWIQDNEYGKAVRASFVGVQYLREGEKFGSAPTDAGGIFQPTPGGPDAAAEPSVDNYDPLA